MVRYVGRRPNDSALRKRLEELAAERRRFGFRRLTVLLRREGIKDNVKRILRVYREANLQVRRRVKRRVALGRGNPVPAIEVTPRFLDELGAYFGLPAAPFDRR
jgi:putative transposase